MFNNMKKFKKNVETFTNSIINKAVLTRLTHFNNFQREAIIKQVN